ncbi:signal recognition particle-docking protein FtsY [Haemophilus paraphrohaemolyticus]|uniref:Signal recognition particle receptor FtsY n=1 Tax=Haemophilus paraphrohaemolyticus HK411 TaxID=1095743 RepID=I2NCF6_9PAST|nr:signal recognition particle-docking protein FtsY [Haemophilus paraphrohaemolyticus]EIG23517.1 signal recognition particle-docking protein FtsY [Haemophilus paraphrohaemolyticus HK411]OOR96373.1 signal recognition particle-docking protein FtsY [Haemophilus paraphrohaemolyticus]STP01147.1 Cell division protein FtsY [Haemophilus paraphrohaemolyticus]
MSEKKKGFWSWLGFGKKEEVKEQVSQEQTIETDSQNLAENAPLIKEEKQKVVEKHETVSEFIEQKLDEAKHFVEEKLDAAEHIIDELEEKIEQSFEEEKEESVAIVDTAHHDSNETLQAVEIADEVATTVKTPEENEAVEETQLEPEQAVEIPEEIAERATETETVTEETQDEYQEKPANKTGFFNRLIQGLIKTKQNIGSGFLSFFRGKKIDDELFEELEEQLLISDLGMPTTTKIINNLTQHATKQQLKDAELLYQQLKLELADVLKPVAQPLEIDTTKKPYVILMVGVNGVGKTTTIGKLAKKFQDEGKSVMLAAGDTFRAAAVEQLQVWGERNHIPVIAQSSGSDSASVIFDAMQSASARNIDVLIADTAGRLQNKNHLMDELKKIVRVMKKYDETAPHEIMLTLDAGTGQNAISQAKLFNEAVGLTGITLTKLDGTAKGGVIFAIADQFNIPIRFIGVGEKIEDLRPFNSEEFIEALFSHEDVK